MRLAFLSCSIVALAVFVAGCEDPVPPTPSGAFSVNFGFASGCLVKNHQAVMGEVTSTSLTDAPVDGINGANVECTVKGGALGPFLVDAELSQGANFLRIHIDQIDSKASSTMPATGSVQFKSATTGTSYGSNEPCEFYITPSTNGEGVSPGSAWVTFKCPSVVSGMSTCSLNESHVYIDNCLLQ